MYLTYGPARIEELFEVDDAMKVVLPRLFAVPEYNYYNGDSYYS